MTITTSLVINYAESSSSSSHAPWVKLEQIVPKGLARYATIKDLYDLWLAAKTGSSTQLIKSDLCPVETDGEVVRLWIDFYVWLSNPETPYSLSSSIGTFGVEQKITSHRAFSLLVDNVKEIELPYYFSADALFTWESNTYDKFGNQIFNVTISVVDGCWLSFSEEVFGVVRVSGNAVGYKERLTIEVDKGEDPEDGHWVEYTLTDFNVDVAVTTADDKAVMHLTDATLPECVSTFLSMCASDQEDGQGGSQANIDLCTGLAQQGLLGVLMIVYYNVCTGEVIHVERTSLGNNKKYCK